MRTIFTIISTLAFLGLQAQFNKEISASSDTTKVFKNQGEQENDWTKQFFEKNYSKQNFPKYDSTIVTKGDTVRYSDKYFLVWTAAEFKPIFYSGIFYPTIITGPSKRDYRLTISNFEELKFLNYSPTVKRFSFWLNRNTLLNPTVCFIELTNQNATDKTDIENFIRGASLTFYKEGWIII